MVAVATIKLNSFLLCIKILSSPKFSVCKLFPIFIPTWITGFGLCSWHSICVQIFVCHRQVCAFLRLITPAEIVWWCYFLFS